MAQSGVPLIPPASRDIQLGALVRQAWGDEWMQPEVGYKFSNGREFRRPGPGQGIYAPVTQGLILQDENYIPLTNEVVQDLYT